MQGPTMPVFALDPKMTKYAPVRDLFDIVFLFHTFSL